MERNCRVSGMGDVVFIGVELTPDWPKDLVRGGAIAGGCRDQIDAPSVLRAIRFGVPGEFQRSCRMS